MAIAPTTNVTKREITAGTGAWWCAGCGDFGVTAAHADELVRLVNEAGVPLENIVIVTGIGCSSKEPDMLHVNSYHLQHGRSLPVAMGIIAANPGLVVLDFGGDGDGYAIGMQHFVHAIRRNPNITYIVMNNQVYGLTKGQASPTAHKGLVTGSTPTGMKDRNVNPLMLGLSVGAAFVARGVSWRKKELQDLIGKAIATRGFSLLDVFS
ncbi:MAG TPA: thiamine pyrophosphate-dependent enzyme, partial [Dehalococcoidia bacterium]|nr:thiamine pyrophosphate-dependent enzyme [Dehalococcoidia bacterium]